MVCDILALSVIKDPAQMGADIAIGTTQQFGMPLGFGGPHAAFIVTKEKYKRNLPGRIIGISKDINNNIAMRMSLQTREQHIRRDKATSNICTAQVLPAIMAVAYAIYHGEKGLKDIATKIHNKTVNLAHSLMINNYSLVSQDFFNTITIRTSRAKIIFIQAKNKKINLRLLDKNHITIAIDEGTTNQQLLKLLTVFNINKLSIKNIAIKKSLIRTSGFLSNNIFKIYHSEIAMMRYLKRLENKDIALNNSMIALGSCTMKLTPSTSMQTINFAGFMQLHPYVPAEQSKGYLNLLNELKQDLLTISGYDNISLQPNAGSQGEFAGLLAISNYHKSIGEHKRNICLIPASAHGTNPASATMAGMQIIIVNCTKYGEVDMNDLLIKVKKYNNKLSCLMITYPSTHGVFEENIIKICQIIHQYGGQVYLDGANLNAMVGIIKIADLGADVSHFNLHKTFAIPHGGGGPGAGPIGVKKHLAKFLPTDPVLKDSGAIAGTMYGNAMVLPISWSYIKMLGDAGLTKATKIAILNANYIAKSLMNYYPILYYNNNKLVAHECIIDIREIKKQTTINEEDIAKRLIDYGFHSPTMSFPVAGTLMIEPTESENKNEIDRFITAMIAIYHEIQEVKNSTVDKKNNVLKNAPHTAFEMTNWHYPYSRKKALYPLDYLIVNKYFPPVKRVDNLYGDKNLFCYLANNNS